MVDEAAREVVGHRLDLPPELLAEALDPRAIVATRTGPGGAAPEPMKAMLAECRRMLAQIEAWRSVTSRRLTNAEADLLSLANRMLVPVEGMATDGKALRAVNGWKDSEYLNTRPVAAESL